MTNDQPPRVRTLGGFLSSPAWTLQRRSVRRRRSPGPAHAASGVCAPVDLGKNACSHRCRDVYCGRSPRRSGPCVFTFRGPRGLLWPGDIPQKERDMARGLNRVLQCVSGIAIAVSASALIGLTATVAHAQGGNCSPQDSDWWTANAACGCGSPASLPLCYGQGDCRQCCRTGGIQNPCCLDVCDAMTGPCSPSPWWRPCWLFG